MNDNTDMNALLRHAASRNELRLTSDEEQPDASSGEAAAPAAPSFDAGVIRRTQALPTTGSEMNDLLQAQSMGIHPTQLPTNWIGSF